MNAGGASEWAGAPGSCGPGDERSGKDRRANARRAPKRPFDPLFTVTLLNQIAPPATDYVRGYEPEAPRVRRGFIVNARA